MRIRQILERKEIILRKKRLVTMLCCIVVLIALGLQLYFLRPKTDNME